MERRWKIGLRYFCVFLVGLGPNAASRRLKIILGHPSRPRHPPKASSNSTQERQASPTTRGVEQQHAALEAVAAWNDFVHAAAEHSNS
eukprot:4096768-Pyramimonas_sp.AAC.1